MPDLRPPSEPLAPSFVRSGSESVTPHRVLLAFSAPQLPLSFLFTVISLYLLKYSTDVLLISPAIIGLVFGLSRFWDALTDPVIGFIGAGDRIAIMLATVVFAAGASTASCLPRTSE